MYALSHLQNHLGAWYWKVHFSRNRQIYYQQFLESQYGGSSQALKAATAWRDTQLAQVKALTVLEFCQKKRSSNTSGVPGVHFLKSTRQPEGFWQAKLKLAEGKYKSKNFSVLSNGYQAAYEMAVAARQDMLANAKDRPYLYSPVAKRLAPKIKA